MKQRIEVIARGIALRGDHLLVCWNDAGGYCYLAGGHVEFGESAAAALRREFLEECGLHVRVGAFALASEGSFTASGRVHHEVNLVFHVEVPDDTDTPTSLEPGISFQWVDLRNLDRTDLRPVGIKSWLMGEVNLKATWVSEMC